MWDFVMEILAPLVLIIAFILLIICLIYLILDFSSRVKEAINNKNYEEIEVKEDEDNEEIDTIQRAIIVIGDEKIEVDVDYYEIDEATVEIESKDGKVYITDIKNVLLMSE